MWGLLALLALAALSGGGSSHNGPSHVHDGKTIHLESLRWAKDGINMVYLCPICKRKELATPKR